MTKADYIFSESRTLLKLAGPLIVNNLSIAGMQFADAVMAGRLGAEALAAVAVGSSVWFLGFMLVLGLMMAISPIAARHLGAGDEALIGRYTRQGVYLAVVIAIPMIIVAQTLVGPFLALIDIDISFRDTTTRYVEAIAWGAPGMFVFLALRFTTEGIGYTKPIMYTSIFAPYWSRKRGYSASTGASSVCPSLSKPRRSIARPPWNAMAGYLTNP